MKDVRKRLSVVSDNALVDGLAAATIDDAEAEPGVGGVEGTIITTHYGESAKGYAPYNPRKANQDAYVTQFHEPTHSLLFVIMDGHGEFGDHVSNFLKNLFPRTLFDEPSFAQDVPLALSTAISKCEEAMLKPPHSGGLGDRNEFSGTTFVATVVRGNQLWCANIGDSRLVVGVMEDGAMVGKDVSEDHKPDLPSEKARILATGGRVFAVRYDDGIDGPARVWLAHADIPGLAMSRSLGDKVAHTAGVSSEPEIFKLDLVEGEHCFLVSATDGLWEFMSTQEVVSMAASYENPTEAVKDLIKEAKARWLREEEVIDDTTVMVAFIGGYRQSPATEPSAEEPAKKEGTSESA